MGTPLRSTWLNSSKLPPSPSPPGEPPPAVEPPATEPLPPALPPASCAPAAGPSWEALPQASPKQESSTIPSPVRTKLHLATAMIPTPRKDGTQVRVTAPAGAELSVFPKAARDSSCARIRSERVTEKSTAGGALEFREGRRGHSWTMQFRKQSVPKRL